MPTRRLQQAGGHFSFVTPDGWGRSNVPGVDFIVVSADPDSGMNPNIFVDFMAPSLVLEDAVAKLRSFYRNHHREYTVLETVDFQTESGLRGVKISARRTSKNQLALGTYQYVIQGPDHVFALTCTCADSVKTGYEPLFDQAMRTLEAEK